MISTCFFSIRDTDEKDFECLLHWLSLGEKEVIVIQPSLCLRLIQDNREFILIHFHSLYDNRLPTKRHTRSFREGHLNCRFLILIPGFQQNFLMRDFRSSWSFFFKAIDMSYFQNHYSETPTSLLSTQMAFTLNELRTGQICKGKMK